MLMNTKFVTVGLTDSVVYGGNMRRRKVMLSSNSTVGNQIFVQFGRSALDPVTSGGFGFVVHNGIPPLVITDGEMGHAIKEEIHAVASAGAPGLTITEFFDH